MRGRHLTGSLWCHLSRGSWCGVVSRETNHKVTQQSMSLQAQTNEGKKKIGGWRGHPNSIAALRAHRGVRWNDRPKCKCGAPAMLGRLQCWRHAGGNIVPVRKGRGEGRSLRGMATLGLLPGELSALPIWTELAALPSLVRHPVRLQLVLAWAERDRQPILWRRVCQLAIDAARSPPVTYPYKGDRTV